MEASSWQDRHVALSLARIQSRTIDQLPGAWMGRWRHLKLYGDNGTEFVECSQFIGHVRATIAYLEANRDAIQSARFWSLPFTGGGQWKAPESSGKPMRLIKR